MLCCYLRYRFTEQIILMGVLLFISSCFNLNGHTRCIRLLLDDYIPSISVTWNLLQKKSKNEYGRSEFNASALRQVINKPADGGITTLHMAALNGHFETVHLLLDLGAFVSEITVEDGATIDLIVLKKKAISSYIFSTNDQGKVDFICYRIPTTK